MTSLTQEQAISFAVAVEKAARPDVRAMVDNVYRAMQDAVDLRRPICAASGRCCRFEEFGHRLFVTTMEMAAFMGGLDREVMPEGWDQSGCPFQVNRLCGVREIRPLGCRVFFCDETSDAWQVEQYERMHRELKRLHEEMKVPYFYVEWREALRALHDSDCRGAAARERHQASECRPPVE